MKTLNNPATVIKLIISAIIFLAVPQLVVAQSNYKLAESPDAFIKVSGSSNVHDWTMASPTMQSQGDFVFSGERLGDIGSLSFQVAVKSLKSEHTSMDSRTYKSLNESKFPTISYKLTSATVTTIQKDKYLIKAKGDLTIAGVTQNISMEVTAVTGPANTITCTGEKKIQLTDYGIKPPSFMLGAMKVYKDLTIQFNLTYKKKS